MKNKVFIKEIFQSIQGEGLHIGVNQLFVRFSKCNLNCKYCDTDFKTDLKEYSARELAQMVNSYKNIHSVSLTGGEPLMETDFLMEFLPLIKHKIYLETNGVLYENLKKVINYTDIISMDIKLPSVSGNRDCFIEHEKFIQVSRGKEIFLKIVFDENITEDEIQRSCELGRKYDLPIVLQPKMNGERLELNSLSINEVFYKFVELNPGVRLIGQMHKFLKIV